MKRFANFQVFSKVCLLGYLIFWRLIYLFFYWSSHNVKFNQFRVYNEEAFSEFTTLCKTSCTQALHMIPLGQRGWILSFSNLGPSRTLGSCKNLPTPRPLAHPGTLAASQSCHWIPKPCNGTQQIVLGTYSSSPWSLAVLQSKWMSATKQKRIQEQAYILIITVFGFQDSPNTAYLYKN